MKAIKKSRLSIGTIVFLLLALVLALPVLAQTGEATTEAEPTVDPEIQQKVEERIQKVLMAQSEKKRGFIGEILDINSTIEIKVDEEEKQIKPNEEVEVVGLNREELTLKDLEIGDYIIAMGYLSENEILETKRILVTEAPEPLARISVLGAVTDQTSEGEQILTLKTSKGVIYEIEVTTKTEIAKPGDDGPEEVKFKEIKVGDNLVVVGTPDEEESNFLTAKLIHLVPTKTLGATEKPITETEATASAEEE